MSVGAILGSAYDGSSPVELGLTPIRVPTRLGDVTLFETPDRSGILLFRHGAPHRFLPNQIPYRAHALALKAVGVDRLLVTSSVGVLDPDVPLHTPLVVGDLLMPENRLPDGTACSIFETPAPDQGHLVLQEGLFSAGLSAQLESQATGLGTPVARRVVFAYAMGPRSKTAAENRLWRQLGAHVNSMTLGPEVVLANELEIPTAALVIGHKYSVAGMKQALDHASIADSLVTGRRAFDRLVMHFLAHAQAVPFGNQIYHY